jgi:hypothetical protein
MRNNRRISQRLDEVLEWKAALARDVEHLPLSEAIREIQRQGNEAVTSFKKGKGVAPSKVS